MAADQAFAFGSRPDKNGEDPNSDAFLLDDVRQGWIRPPPSAGREMLVRKAVMKLREIMADLQDDRAER
jgi:hypothetical protein